MAKIDIAALRAKALASIAAANALIVVTESTQPVKELNHVSEDVELDSQSDAVDADSIDSADATAGSDSVGDSVSVILQVPAGVGFNGNDLQAASEQIIPAVGSAVELTPQQFMVVEKIAQLRELLLASDPQMPVLLKQIHTVLHKQPELVYFLQPEQVGTIVKACMEQTKVVVVATAVKATKTASGKKLSQIGLEDI